LVIFMMKASLQQPRVWRRIAGASHHDWRCRDIVPGVKVHGRFAAGATRRFGLVCTLRDLKAGLSRPPSTDQLQSLFSYFFTIRRVGATVLAGAIGEIEKVSHVFHPDGRFSAANSP
jgi:hypothetical protein